MEGTTAAAPVQGASVSDERAAESGGVPINERTESGTQRQAQQQEDDQGTEEGVLSVGCLVQMLDIDADVFHMLQQKLESQSPDLAEVTYTIGEVLHVDAQNDGILVTYPRLGRSHVMHRAVLSKLAKYPVGARVTLAVIDPQARRMMIDRVGVWTQDVENHVEDVGELLEWKPDHSAMVKFGSKSFRLHPGCLAKATLSTLTRKAEASYSRYISGTGKKADDTTSQPSTAAATSSPSSSTGKSAPPSLNSSASGANNSWQNPASGAYDSPGSNPSGQTHGIPHPTSSVVQGQFRSGGGNVMGEWRRSPSGKENDPVHMIGRAILEHDDEKLRQILRLHPASNNSRIGERAYNFLQVAVESENASSAGILVEHGADVNQQDLDGISALHMAAMRDIPVMAEALLKLGARVNLMSMAGHTPLHVATVCRNIAFLRALIRCAPDLDLDMEDGEGGTALHAAVSKDNRDIVEVLVEGGAIVSQINPKGANALQNACASKSIHSLEYLIGQAPALINEPRFPQTEHTLLHVAAGSNSFLILKMMLERPEADLEAKDSIGATPLRTALAHGCRSSAELLVVYGASIHAEDQDGNSMMHIPLARFNMAHANRLTDTELLPAYMDSAECAPRLDEIQRKMPFDREPLNRLAAIACLMAQLGCDMSYINHNGFSAWDFADNLSVVSFGESGENRRSAATLKRVLNEYLDESKRDTDFAGCKSLSRRARSRDNRAASSLGPVQSNNCSVSLASPGGGECAPPAVKTSVAADEAGDMSSSEVTVEEAVGRVCHSRRCTYIATVTFLPCQHIITCKDCCFEYNLCGRCHAVVEKRMHGADEVIDPTAVSAVPSAIAVAVQPARQSKPPREIRLACNFQTPFRKPSTTKSGSAQSASGPAANTAVKNRQGSHRPGATDDSGSPESGQDTTKYNVF